MTRQDMCSSRIGFFPAEIQGTIPRAVYRRKGICVMALGCSFLSSLLPTQRWKTEDQIYECHHRAPSFVHGDTTIRTRVQLITPTQVAGFQGDGSRPRRD